MHSGLRRRLTSGPSSLETRTPGTYQTTIFDLGKALTEAKRIGRGSTVSAIYERGRFQAGGREVVAGRPVLVVGERPRRDGRSAPGQRLGLVG